jgi:hypothetical protein
MGSLKSAPNVFGLLKAIDPIKLIFFNKERSTEEA